MLFERWLTVLRHAINNLRRRFTLPARLCLPLALIAGLGAASLGAAPVQPGPRILPGPPSGSMPDAAMDAQGNFVLVWQVPAEGGEFGAGPQIYARRYNADGAPVGPAFPVDERDPANQSDPSVAMAPDGAFMIAWTADTVVAGIRRTVVWARRYSAAGVAGERFLVSPEGAFDDHRNPSVALDAAGNALIAWERFVLITVSYTEVYARRFSASGAPGAELLVSGGPAADSFTPAVALDQDGDGLIAWTRRAIDAGSFGLAAIYARRLPAVGGFGAELPVAGGGQDEQREPVVALDPIGNAVIAWTNTRFLLPEDGDDDIYARRLPLIGAPGPVFGVNATTAGQQNSPQIALDREGTSVISWRSTCCSPARRVNNYRQFTFDGSTSGEDRQIAVLPRNSEHPPALAGAPDGSFVAVWDGIEARLFRPPAVQIFQSNGRTEVREGVATEDSFAVALRTIPTAPVTITLATDPNQLELFEVVPDLTDDRFNRPHQEQGELLLLRLRFEPDSSALEPIEVLVRAIDDRAAEGVHSVPIFVSAVGPGSGYSTTTPLLLDGSAAADLPVVVFDNDDAAYIVASDTAGTNEGNSSPVTFSVRRSGAIEGLNRVTYVFTGTATFGRDYRIAGGTAQIAAERGAIDFAPGQSEQTIVIVPVDDTVGEPNKSVVLELREPLPQGSGRIIFPVAVLTLGDNDLAEVRVTQSDGSTTVARGGADDTLTVELRTTPIAPVAVILTPTSKQLNLGSGWGAPHRLIFAAAEQGVPQKVRVFTAGGAAASLAESAAITLASRSADPSYDKGARFTVDGRDAHELPVTIAVPPGSGPGISSIYLPLVRR